VRSLVMDGEETPRYDALGIHLFGMGKDLTRRCFVVSGAKGNQDLVSVNGQESKLYNEVAGAHVAEDEKSVAFYAREGRRILRVTYKLP
jgi:hypothetical protein